MLCRRRSQRDLPGRTAARQPLPIFITGDGYGTHIKLPGSAYPDPNTGQLTVSSSTCRSHR